MGPSRYDQICWLSNMSIVHCRIKRFQGLAIAHFLIPSLYPSRPVPSIHPTKTIFHDEKRFFTRVGQTLDVFPDMSIGHLTNLLLFDILCSLETFSIHRFLPIKEYFAASTSR